MKHPTLSNAPRRSPRLVGACGSLLVLVVGCAAADGASPESEANQAALSAPDVAHLRKTLQRDPLTPELRIACPDSRTDELCTTLRDAASSPSSTTLARARDAATERLARGPRHEALRDAAFKYWLRERAQGLGALHAVAGLQAPASAPSGFADGVERHLRTHYSLYEASTFRFARAYLPPPTSSGSSCPGREEALLVFPGVIRLPSKSELESHIAAIRASHPCLYVVRVNTETFVDVETNVTKGRQAIAGVHAAIGNAPLHFLGYSQGVTNALATIASDPSIAGRTRSVLSLNSAAHGSEAADTLLRTLHLYESRPSAGCGELWPGVRELCETVGHTNLSPVAGFLQTMLERMGAHFDDLEGSTLDVWLARHVAGLRSLTTAAAQTFWTEHGASLPGDAVYLTFRSVIVDETQELPQSNWLSYQVIARSSPAAPWNDMQVRLVNHPLGGDVAATEIVMPVANGNHWQWALTSTDVPERLMPSRMFAGVPREAMVAAQYEALAEVGLMDVGGAR
jgi:hypothetical protein